MSINRFCCCSCNGISFLQCQSQSTFISLFFPFYSPLSPWPNRITPSSKQQRREMAPFRSCMVLCDVQKKVCVCRHSLPRYHHPSSHPRHYQVDKNKTGMQRWWLFFAYHRLFSCTHNDSVHSHPMQIVYTFTRLRFLSPTSRSRSLGWHFVMYVPSREALREEEFRSAGTKELNNHHKWMVKYRSRVSQMVCSMVRFVDNHTSDAHHLTPFVLLSLTRQMQPSARNVTL